MQTLEELKDRNVRLPNGELMDLYLLRKGVVVYGTSVEGDEYMIGPYFYAIGDAILNALHPMFISSQTPLDTKLRLREYRLTKDVLMYDAKGKVRPSCSPGILETASFKSDFDMRLPEGNNPKDLASYSLIAPSGKTRTSKAQDLPVEDIISNITSNPDHDTEYLTLRLDAVVMCDPGKSVVMAKSYRIDMEVLYTFYASLLSKGYAPDRIRNEAFIGPRSKMVIEPIIGDKHGHSSPQNPEDYIPVDLSKAINRGEPLEQLNLICAKSKSSQNACMSGSFFNMLWDRDVKSISAVYPKAALIPNSDSNLTIDMLKAVSTSNSDKKSDVAKVTTWYYREDFMANMGPGASAYDWNYNRFMDVNTLIYWMLSKMSQPYTVEGSENTNPRGIVDVKPASILKTDVYDPSEHLSSILHRPIDYSETDRIGSVKIYDAAGEVEIKLHFSVYVGSLQDRNMMALYVETKIQELGDKTSKRPILNRVKIQQKLEEFISKTNGLLAIEKGPLDLMGHENQELQIISLAPSNQTFGGIPVNWLLLSVISSWTRYLIRHYEFSLFSF